MSQMFLYSSNNRMILRGKNTWSCIYRGHPDSGQPHPLDWVSFQKKRAKGRAPPLSKLSTVSIHSEQTAWAGVWPWSLCPGVTLTALESKSSGLRGPHTGSIWSTGCRAAKPWRATKENIKCEARCQDVTKQGLGGNRERAEWPLHILNYQLL